MSCPFHFTSKGLRHCDTIINDIGVNNNGLTVVLNINTQRIPYSLYFDGGRISRPLLVEYVLVVLGLVSGMTRPGLVTVAGTLVGFTGRVGTFVDFTGLVGTLVDFIGLVGILVASSLFGSR